MERKRRRGKEKLHERVLREWEEAGSRGSEDGWKKGKYGRVEEGKGHEH